MAKTISHEEAKKVLAALKDHGVDLPGEVQAVELIKKTV